ncbi:MAG TPA: efflux RND transporter periplasmic adaptor subunit [Phenylobacterium sp.]|jgi:RND family efflux transporter MFP subunit|uniref:efflux RND transporter periplasmic adaptor subunit n=1 Tax=Phenylobacterium sp. TaxID=1871053 RepID=UPI002D5B1D0D|nr:efflux RND transporter periplasmic adaptor subunit [Phenylobacterium sp.]HZZ68783.1 efflux RND transporter periplasmic adaptor subunit [Phenylobacterium sp.]
MPSDIPSDPAAPKAPPPEAPANPHNTPEVLRHGPQRWVKPAGLVAIGVAAAVVVTGVVTRGVASASLKATTAEAAIPTVDLIAPSSDTSAETLTLPADVEANDTAPIHARVSGYIHNWYVDIGAHVKAGQVLADIDTPDLDQQLAQVKAAQGTAAAHQNLAKISADRWNRLLSRDAVSHQEADEKTGDLAAKTADVQAAHADLQRLQALEAFKKITAPFAGIVTTRTAHVGALVAAGTPNDAPLFTVADVHRLRIYVHVPQSYSAQIKPGITATLAVPEYPGREFKATLVSTSGAVGAQSGAVQAELQMDNPDETLKPGDYAQATFQLARAGGATLKLPASALMFRQKGLAVGVVDAQNHAHLRYITLRHDLGATVEVAAGLGAGERVIDNPPDSLQEGEKVRIAAPNPAAPNPAAPTPAGKG